MSVTVYDVARQAGVSIKTVSRVVNHEDRVTPATRQKVLAAVEQLDYVPNEWARRLASGHSGLIGLVTHDAAPAYIMDVINGLMDYGDELGYRVSLKRFDNRDPDMLGQAIAMASQKQVEGLIFTPPCDNSPQLVQALQAMDFPFIQLTPHDRCQGCAWVAATDETGSYQATRHLLQLCHTRIGIIQGKQNHRASWDRLAGYRRALTEAGVQPDAELIKEGSWTFDGGLLQARALLSLPKPPTAIMAGNDEAAAGVLHAAWDIGLACPQQLSVVGFDDLPLAKQLTPPLTTVRQPIYEMARTAMAVLTRQLIPGNGNKPGIEIPTQLIVRSSTGPPPPG